MKKWLYILLMFAITLWAYIEFDNRNTKKMTVRQKIMKAFYPVISYFNNVKRTEKMVLKNDSVSPAQNLFELPLNLNTGEVTTLSKYKGRKLLLVNTASNCGLTGQYEELQALYEKYKGKLEIIGFPANDFKEQEKGSDEDIAQFCKINYGVQFPLAKKSTVVKVNGQNEIFEWLTDPTKNGWNKQQPTWNFAKYLIDENGRLRYYFDPTLSPMSNEITAAIEEK